MKILYYRRKFHKWHRFILQIDYQESFINLFSQGTKSVVAFPAIGSPTTSQTVTFVKLTLSEVTANLAGFPAISRN